MKKRNTTGQKRMFLSPPHMSGEEQRLVRDAFASNYIAPLGPMVDAFEKAFVELTGFKYALALSSGTAAMHLALRELGVGSGDRVIASTLTFIGSVSPVTFLGATPVFIDADRTSWCMDPNLLEDELKSCARHGQLPKAVVPTDLYGNCCNLPVILDLCRKYDVPVICDSAEAVGASFRDKGKTRHAGFGAKAAVYSFNGNKIITTGGGGMLCSDDERLISHARKLSTQARDHAPHYEHSEIGYNYRLSNVLAAIGLGQLKSLSSKVNKRRRIYEWYREGIDGVHGIQFIPEPDYCRSNRWLTVILIDDRDSEVRTERFRERLESQNIEARPVWKPMHMQPVFQGCRVRGGSVSEDLFSRGLCLPSGTGMTRSDVDRVAGFFHEDGE